MSRSLTEEEDTLIVLLEEPRDLTLLCCSDCSAVLGYLWFLVGSKRSCLLVNRAIVIRIYNKVHQTRPKCFLLPSKSLGATQDSTHWIDSEVF